MNFEKAEEQSLLKIRFNCRSFPTYSVHLSPTLLHLMGLEAIRLPTVFIGP